MDEFSAARPPAPVDEGAVPPSGRTIQLGRSRYPLVLPNVRDVRLHVAAVVITVHILGQTVLGFRVSVVQIFAAMATCFAIELTIVFARDKRIVWPASAMLTGSGVGLILRLPDMPAHRPWSTHSWWIYSLVAGGSLVTKYVIRDRGRHVFNPSNLGLVFVFLVLGSHWVEPLDFWWAPVGPAMVFAYAVIIAGGTFVTHRIGLLPMVATFWAVLGAGLAVLAVSGHAIYSPWSLHPVAGWHFWWVVLTSPETLVFVCFMLSDPKTVPQERSARLVFGATVGALAVVLIAPQHTEFGTKVALLGALTICSMARPLVRRLRNLPMRTLAVATASRVRAVAVASLGLVVLGGTTSAVATRAPSETVDARALPSRPPVHGPTPALPSVAATAEAIAFDPMLRGSGRQQLATALVTILELELDASLHERRAVLASVDFGQRLADMQSRIDALAGTGAATGHEYSFDTLGVIVVRSRTEGANRIALEATGNVTDVDRRQDGTTTRSGRQSFHRFFVLRRATDRWLLVDEFDQESRTTGSLQ